MKRKTNEKALSDLVREAKGKPEAFVIRDILLSYAKQNIGNDEGGIYGDTKKLILKTLSYEN